jgi:hypothetical protein
VLADQVSDVQVQQVGQLRLVGEGLREVEPGLEEQDGHVRPDPRRHVHHAGPLGLERRGDRDALKTRLEQRPAHDLRRIASLEPFVHGGEVTLGEQGLGHREASRSGMGSIGAGRRSMRRERARHAT